MSLAGEQVLLRAYLQNADRTPFTPTHERIVKAARNENLAGATVLRGILGVGYHGIIQSSGWSIVEHVPIVVEVVDRAEKIARFIQGPLDQIMVGGMLTLERAAVMMYRHTAGDHPEDLQLAGAVEPLLNMPRIEPAGQMGSHMQTNESGILLRVFIGESDRFEGKHLHEAIIQKVRELGLAGATVLRGSEGFGANSVVHKASLLAMSTDLPIIIEIVDAEEKVRLLLPHLEKMVKEGMITMEHVMILMYRHNAADAPQPSAPPSPDAMPQK
jgi:PII-like signaling protein